MCSYHLTEIEQYQSIKDIILREKLAQFRESFESRTKTDLEYVVRAPGRINLIGDHIDYHGFAVLPMAIENSILLGCSFNRTQTKDNSNHLRIYNQNPEVYPDVICDHSFLHGCHLDQSHKWHHYVLCGYHGILVDRLLGIEPSQALQHAKNVSNSGEQASETQLDKLAQFNIMIQSDLPSASGLSSSSALVCASSIATLLLLKASKVIQNLELDNKQIAKDCSKFEHLIGTHGGGMDQAVIMTAHRGYAKHVEFMPQLECYDVQLPKNVSWLVSHCGSDYPKATTAGFNSRVLETKLGAAMIAKVFGGEHSDIVLDKSITLGIVRQIFFNKQQTSYIVAQLRERVFPRDALTLADICSTLNSTIDQLLNRFATTREFLDENFGNKFYLRKRCEHIFEESERVEKFKSLCDNDTIDVNTLGDLMTKSHFSLRDKYDCSHPALDKLVDISLKSGALGARLTGAGWGGCIVTLVESDKCEYVHKKLSEASKFTFRTEPQSGCSIIKF